MTLSMNRETLWVQTATFPGFENKPDPSGAPVQHTQRGKPLRSNLAVLEGAPLQPHLEQCYAPS